VPVQYGAGEWGWLHDRARPPHPHPPHWFDRTRDEDFPQPRDPLFPLNSPRLQMDIPFEIAMRSMRSGQKTDLSVAYYILLHNRPRAPAQ